MTDSIHEELVRYVTNTSPSARLFRHPASKTSEESREARFKASGEYVTGAKALLVKLDVRDQSDVYAVVVLPGMNKLDSKGMKAELKQRIVGLRDFRFATPDEMTRVAQGLQPGKMPPFGRPFFPLIRYTFIDSELFDHPRIGFNAADFESSIIMDSSEYRALVEQDGMFPCSVAGTTA